ncbi:MAG: hypothetical protein CMJ33_07955 [Phycisphaerae bacterium]|nr:hypothetical protein [Phycisphaerae bacterium]HAW94757.1 hypothetical protein [Phycisphaerales bacterium]
MTSAPLRVTRHDLPVIHPEGERTLWCDITVPEVVSRGTFLIAHGFKGYKDYGMFPRLAWTAARHGWTAIRFNFAHSGMTRADSTFERPDLFALDTWNRQVSDLDQLVAAVRAGGCPECPSDGPLVLFGHSRGGLASILAAGRGLAVDAVISASAPMDPLRFTDEDLRRLRQEGACPVESSRTGQVLSVGRAFLDEVELDPAGHDPCEQASRMAMPLVVVHGASDETVSCEDGLALAKASGVDPVLIEGGNHVFNVANPFHPEDEPSSQLAALENVILDVLRTF